MFIYSEWEKFCKNISSKYDCIRADQILNQSKKSKWLVIKHDVETDVQRALDIAEIENKYGIKATYYVQSYLLEDNITLLTRIGNLGHEVTYHYDVLDSNNGDYSAARKEFEETISNFSHHNFEVKTVCPHGNPIIQRDGWSSNKDFFRNEDIKKAFPEILDIVVQLPELIQDNFVYISDAGYGWKKIGNINNNDIENKGDKPLSLETVIELVASHNLIISAHPHRWRRSRLVALYRLYLFKLLRRTARLLSSNPFLKRIMSKYYHLAKKI